MMADTPVAPRPTPTLGHDGVPIGWIAGAVLALAAVGNLLLPAFLGLPAVACAPLVLIGAAAIGWLTARGSTSDVRLPVATIAACFALALVLLLLGGEGRIFFAPADWQIRDAVLGDLGRHPWPFVYARPGGDALLRAPLGMYLLPALAGPGQNALDLTLLGTNTLMLGLLCALASTLFAPGRPRRIAAIVFLLFSGLDAVGTLAMHLSGEPASPYHIDNWAPGSQFTSTIAQLFWAPQHAIAGWACALFFLLWQQRKLAIGAFTATVPLLAFWSPLAAAGALPFALLAGAASLRRLRPIDVALAVSAVVVAIPALFYQHLDAASVGAGLNPIRPTIYAAAIVLEVLPFALPVLLMRPASRFGRGTLPIAVAMLLLAPLWRIGAWHDFQMRVTIVPLAILAAAVAELLLRGDRWRPLLLALLAIGALTGASELFATLTMRATPPPGCSLVGAARQQTGIKVPTTTYFAAAATLPHWALGEHPAVIAPARDPARCWSRPWFVARTFFQ